MNISDQISTLLDQLMTDLKLKSGIMVQNSANISKWIFQQGYQSDITGSVLIAQIKHTKITQLSIVLSGGIDICLHTCSVVRPCILCFFQALKTLRGPTRSGQRHREVVYTPLLPITEKQVKVLLKRLFLFCFVKSWSSAGALI